MPITFSSIRAEDYELIRQFLSAMGWSHRVSDRIRFEKMMRNADRTIVAWSAENQIIGFGRALSDDASSGYLSLIAVAPEFRGRGIGREIVTRLIGDDTKITWILRGGRESRGFWERMGFTPSEIAMERIRA